jgi:hypothetical protein
VHEMDVELAIKELKSIRHRGKMGYQQKYLNMVVIY